MIGIILFTQCHTHILSQTIVTEAYLESLGFSLEEKDGQGCTVTALTIVKGITMMAVDYDTLTYGFCQSAFLAIPMKQLCCATVWVFNSSIAGVLESHLYRSERAVACFLKG